MPNARTLSSSSWMGRTLGLSVGKENTKAVHPTSNDGEEESKTAGASASLSEASYETTEPVRKTSKDEKKPRRGKSRNHHVESERKPRPSSSFYAAPVYEEEVFDERESYLTVFEWCFGAKAFKAVRSFQNKRYGGQLTLFAHCVIAWAIVDFQLSGRVRIFLLDAYTFSSDPSAASYLPVEDLVLAVIYLLNFITAITNISILNIALVKRLFKEPYAVLAVTETTLFCLGYGTALCWTPSATCIALSLWNTYMSGCMYDAASLRARNWMRWMSVGFFVVLLFVIACLFLRITPGICAKSADQMLALSANQTSVCSASSTTTIIMPTDSTANNDSSTTAGPSQGTGPGLNQQIQSSVNEWLFSWFKLTVIDVTLGRCSSVLLFFLRMLYASFTGGISACTLISCPMATTLIREKRDETENAHKASPSLTSKTKVGLIAQETGPLSCENQGPRLLSSGQQHGKDERATPLDQSCEGSIEETTAKQKGEATDDLGGKIAMGASSWSENSNTELLTARKPKVLAPLVISLAPAPTEAIGSSALSDPDHSLRSAHSEASVVSLDAVGTAVAGPVMPRTSSPGPAGQSAIQIQPGAYLPLPSSGSRRVLSAGIELKEAPTTTAGNGRQSLLRLPFAEKVEKKGQKDDHSPPQPFLPAGQLNRHRKKLIPVRKRMDVDISIKARWLSRLIGEKRAKRYINARRPLNFLLNPFQMLLHLGTVCIAIPFLLGGSVGRDALWLSTCLFLVNVLDSYLTTCNYELVRLSVSCFDFWFILMKGFLFWTSCTAIFCWNYKYATFFFAYTSVSAATLLRDALPHTVRAKIRFISPLAFLHCCFIVIAVLYANIEDRKCLNARVQLFWSLFSSSSGSLLTSSTATCGMNTGTGEITANIIWHRLISSTFSWKELMISNGVTYLFLYTMEITGSVWFKHRLAVISSPMLLVEQNLGLGELGK